MTLRRLLPLAAHVVPTVVIGYGVVIPRSCIAGVNELTVGFALSIASSAVAYWLGVRWSTIAPRAHGSRDGSGRGRPATAT